MTHGPFEPGALLANRYRVVGGRPGSGMPRWVVDARDELSAGGQRVRLLVVEAGPAQELESNLRRALRYAIGVRGLAELLGVVDLGEGRSGIAYALPEGRALDEALACGEGPWDGERVGRLSGAIERALVPLHQQGLAHGRLSPELVVEAVDGGVAVLGFGLAQALDRSAAPSPLDDRAALEALVQRLTSSTSNEPAAPPPPTLEGATAPVVAPELVATSGEAATSLCVTAPAASKLPAVPVAPAVPAAPTQELAAPVGAPPEPPVSAPRSSERKTGPTERLNPPPVPLRFPRPAPPVGRPQRPWVAILALVMGGVVMVGGVIGAFVFSRRYAASSAPSAPALPPVPTVTSPGHVEPLPSTELAPPSPPSSSPEKDVAPPSSAPAPTSSAPIQEPASASARLPATHERAAIPVDAQVPAWGPWEAPVTLTLFADLECPHSRALIAELWRVKEAFGNDLRWVFRHRPLNQHARAEASARLLAAVGAELGAGAFWKLLRELGRDRESDPEEIIETWLERAGLDKATRARLVVSAQGEAIVERDTALGARLFVRSTPTVFINGIRWEGFAPETMWAEAVKKERRAAIFALLGGAEPNALYPERTLRNLVNLGDDPTERACLPTGGSPARGPANAPVTIVTFCAFESGYCQKAEPELKALLARYPREVRVVWKSFPVAIHGEGRLAANFALAARAAGGDAAFWSVHRALLDARAVLDAPGLSGAVQKLGLDPGGLLAEAQRGAHDASIDADLALGKRLGVSGVPTYFVNGVRKEGLLSLAELEQLVKSELAIGKHLSSIGRGAIEQEVCSALGR